MMPQLSFIIPAYNCSSTIERCFDSIYVCGLDNNDFEVVVGDDASTDDTYKIISQYAATHSNMIVERFSTNKKPGACVNCGIDCASGQYKQFMGADDTIDSSSSIIGALEQAVRWNVDIQANAFIFEKEKDHFVSVGCDYTPGVCMSGTVFCENFFDANLQFCSGPMYFWKRDFVLSDHRRAVEDRYYEDTDWIEYMLPKAKRLAFFNKPVYK